MRVFRNGLVAVLAASLGASPVFAQSHHIVDPSAVAGLVRDHVNELDAGRATVRRVLAQPDVRAVASSVGLDAGRLDAAVATMAPHDIVRAAEAARAVEAAVQSAPLQSPLVGGASTVTISTTTIIIGLLVLILIIVAVD